MTTTRAERKAAIEASANLWESKANSSFQDMNATISVKDAMPKLYNEYMGTAAVLRAHLEMLDEEWTFLEDCIECFKQFDSSGEAYRYDMTKALAAYRALVAKREGTK